jgi:hypothetical protein
MTDKDSFMQLTQVAISRWGIRLYEWFGYLFPSDNP